MLIYNTTYHTDLENARNFVIWINECYLPQVAENGILKNPRLAKILSHQEEDLSECFSLQFEVADTATLHLWHTLQGAKLNEELVHTFKDKVVGFPTLMDVII
ncbi:MAG: DUF4286 family protein [Bacteroidaceae bacterium]